MITDLNRGGAEARSKTGVTEEALRQLRANIYGDISDGGWMNVRERWHEPHNVRWLRENQAAAKRLFQR